MFSKTITKFITKSPLFARTVHTRFPTHQSVLSTISPEITQQFQRASSLTDGLIKYSQMKPGCFFQTKQKMALVDMIDTNVRHMVGGNFINTSGSTSKLIHSETGIGKTSAFHSIITGIAARYYNVIPVYAEYSGIICFYNSPRTNITRALMLDERTSINKIIDHLQSKDLYILFIADALDSVYMSLTDKRAREEVIIELDELSRNSSGRIFTVAAGNSRLIPSIITKHSSVYSELIKEFYPLLQYVPPLNRFRPFVISHQLSLTDYQEIAKFYEFDPRFAHQLFFLGGSNLRTIAEIVKCIKINGFEELAQLCEPPTNLTSNSRQTYLDNKEIIDVLNHAFIRRNTDVIKEVFKCANSTHIDWIFKFCPIFKKDILSILSNYNVSESTLHMLIEKGFFACPPTLDVLWPSAPIHLLHHWSTYCSTLIVPPKYISDAVTDSIVKLAIYNIIKTGQSSSRTLVQNLLL